MADRPPPRGRRSGAKPGGPKSGGHAHKPPHHSSGRGPGPGSRSRPEPREASHSEGPAGLERLQKILAHAGVGSRRACEEVIRQGRVTVDGVVVRELGTRVDPHTVRLAVDGELIRPERMVYYAVHKPKGYVSTNNDPAGRPRVVDLLPEVPERVYAVGRLDEQSTGLMLLMNDGELANKLAHPKYGVEKVYRVVVAGEPGREVFDKMLEGVWLAEGKVKAKRVRPVARRGQATVLEMTLAEGKNREIRRMLAKFGHKVMSLTRVAVGPVALKGLPVGESRPLTGHEIDQLRKVAAGLYVPSPREPDRRPRTPRPGGAHAARTAEGGPPPEHQRRPPAAGRPAPRTQHTRPGSRDQQGPPPQARRPQGPGGPPRPQGPSGPPRPHPHRPEGTPPQRPHGPAPRAGGRPTPPPPPPAPRPPRPKKPAGDEEGPRRIIIGLNPPPPRPESAGPPGPRLRRPAPRRAPRAAQGVKRGRPPETGEGGTTDTDSGAS